jgi:CheY-like chemotaxis protein
MLSDNDFHKHLRRALNHLYNRDFLRKSPLIILFGISGRSDPSSVLQRILLDGIDALKSLPSEPIRSEKRKVYEILLYRYVQQFTQDEVAHHTGLSERQFRREQEKAIDYLAEQLLRQYADRAAVPAIKPEPAGEEDSSRQNEWGWLREQPSERVTNLKPFILGLLELMRGVASQNSVELLPRLPDSLPDLAVHPIALRQMLLNLLQVGIHHAVAGKVILDVSYNTSFVRFFIQSHTTATASSPARLEQENNLLQISAHLSKICGGRLEIQQADDRFSGELFLPAVDGICVLAVDDHPEIIDLLQRYTEGTRYRITGINDPEKIFDLVEVVGPQMIVMDVMMPKIDGWEMLGRLRTHPLTATTPVIILTILAQEELALSLGARALVLKPVTQKHFLSALDRVFANSDSSSHLQTSSNQ